MSNFKIPEGTVMLWRCPSGTQSPRCVYECAHRNPHHDEQACHAAMRLRPVISGTRCEFCVPCGFRVLNPESFKY